MGSLFQTVSFVSPWILAGLLSLPALWWLLRIMPPAPRRIEFPALRLLLNLQTEEKTPNDAPWWLILLRLLAAARDHPRLCPSGAQSRQPVARQRAPRDRGRSTTGLPPAAGRGALKPCRI